MATPFFSAAQMSALQEFALRGMQTTVTIQRKTLTDNDYGDRETVTWTPVATIKAWFWSRPTPVQTEDVGAVITVNTYRLFVPVGTDIRVGDQIKMGVDLYIVSDTTTESTWKAMLVCSLRRRE
jgi:hypothetical protein